MHELRVYSLLADTFGQVVAARALRAAQCLTSVQWSPTGEHVLVAYGRRHMDLLRSFVAQGDAILPVYTVIDVYRVADMALVRSLPSAVDEVNVACFHPHPGGGIVYGTKEGRLRLLTHSRGGGGDATRAERPAPRTSTTLEDSLVHLYGTGEEGAAPA
jgi:activator-of-BECN1-regulated-autophagy protein 1